MICKKCGNNIADTAKFCGICGSKVEETIIPSIENVAVQNSEIVESNVVNTPVQANEMKNSLDSTVNVSVEQNQTNQLSSVNSVEQTAVIPTVSSQQPGDKQKNKSYTWAFVLGGILLGIIAIIILFFALNKSSNTSVRELEKALNNIVNTGENSGTIDAKILMETDTSDTYNLSAIIKYAKQYDDNYNIALTLNKSILYDEMNFYAIVTDDDITLFTKSSVIDMLGLTSSSNDMWLYFLMTKEELEIESETEIKEDGRFYLSNILDKNHYKLISEENGLKHYQLTIDNKLLDNLKSQAESEEELQEFEDALSEVTGGGTELIDVYYIDIYINDLGELVKISMDLTDEFADESIKKVVISFEFSNFGNTVVEIPNETKNSMINLESYISTYTVMEDSNENTYYEDDYSYNY